MKKFLKKKLNNEKGLTLIELLAATVILAIIAAIAIPAIGNIIENSRVGAVKSDYINAVAAAELYILDNPADTAVDLNDLLGTVAAGATPKEKYLSDKGSLLTFVYNPTAKTFEGTATAGNVDLNAGAGTTKQAISSIANNADATVAGTSYGTVTLKRR